jgi:hypothetical protein
MNAKAATILPAAASFGFAECGYSPRPAHFRARYRCRYGDRQWRRGGCAISPHNLNLGKPLAGN